MPPPGWADWTTEDLLRRLAQLVSGQQNNDETNALREEIVRRSEGLVREIAYEFSSSGEPWEELLQVGYLGLLNAAHNFECKRDLKFSTYATHLIRGEMRHHIRERYLVHIPEWLQRLSERVKTTEAQFYTKHGRPPRLKELSRELNISPEGLQEILKAREALNYISLDSERRSRDPRPQIDITKIRGLERQLFPIELRIRVAMAIEKLSDLQRRVIDGLFYRGASQQELGQQLGYSQKHISRLKEQGLQEIKKELEREE